MSLQSLSRTTALAVAVLLVDGCGKSASPGGQTTAGKVTLAGSTSVLPFIEMPRLLAAMETKAHLLSVEDQARNKPGKDVLLISDAHLGLYEDETAELCHWHVPMAHFLESWSDARAHDGTTGVVFRVNRDDLLRPRVKVLVDAQGRWYEEPHVADLRIVDPATGEYSCSIDECLPASEVGIDDVWQYL